MYGLWLYKEIETEYGYCKVEIFRRGYNGSQIEIGALAANSLAISLENLGEITAPIGKSVCSFEIIDTDQINYDDFFTPDATAYKVVVSSRGGSGAYVTRWSGYITPDFFAENLSYRTPISISARDNIGYLNDVDFDLDAATVTIRQLITSAFARIAEDYPMNLEFVTAKQTAEGILAIDATISTLLLKEMSWGEALETILHDLGLQMRWVDNNTIAVMDLSQIPEYYGIQEFNFIQSSGYREILPAWRQLSQSQDYGLRENFFEGWLREDNISYVKTIVMRPPNATNWTTDIAYYVPNNWGVARDIYTISPQYYGAKFGKKIYFTGVSEEYPTTTYLSWRQQIQSSNTPMQIAFNAFNSVLYPSEKYSNVNTPSMRRLVAYNPKDAFHGEKKGEFLQIGLKMNILLHSGLKSYVLRDNWVDIDSAGDWQLNFTLPKVELSYVEGGQATATEPTEQEVTINIATIPYDGEIELRIYGWYIVDKHNYWEDDWTLTDYQFDWLKCLSYINDPIFSYNNDEPATGQDASILVNSLHNVKNSQDYIFGEVPLDNGGVNAYAGGLYKADGNELVGFQRNADSTNYNLLELVGREVIHFNKKNYNKLSGTIKNLDKEPLMFNRLFVREGKTYAPFAYSLNVISNEMNITTMQEVEPYETASFTQIDSEVTTGGATVGGGNNTVLQYSEDAGNAKRIYELNAATEQEKKDGYLIIDNANYPEAKKVHISEVLSDLGLSLVEQDGTTYLKSEHSFFTEKDIFAGGLGEEGASGGIIQQVYGASAFGGTFDANNLTDTFNAYAINSLYSTIQRGVKNPYALTINGTPYDGSSPVDITISGGGGGVSGDYLPLSGGTMQGSIIFPTNTYNYIGELALIVMPSAPTILQLRTTNSSAMSAISFHASTKWYGTLSADVDSNLRWNDNILIHSGNIGDYALPLSYMSLTPTVESNLPYAGGLDSGIAFTKDFTKWKTFIGSYQDDNNTWQNLISVRHRNGINDGADYGMYIKTTLVSNGNLVWNKQIGASKGWQGERTLLDSSNYSSYALPKSGGVITNNLTVAGYLTIGSTTNTTVIKSFVDGTTNFTTIGGAANPVIINNDNGNISLWKGTNDRQLTIEKGGNISLKGANGGWEAGLKYTLWNGTNVGAAAGALGGSTSFEYFYYGGGYQTAAMYIKQNGNVLVGTTSDNGYKLNVNGSAFLAGNLHIKPSNGVSSLDLYVPAYTADSYSMIAVHASTSNTSQISMGIKFGGSQTTSLSYGLEVFNSRGNCYYNATAHYFTGNTQVTGNFIATGDITAGSDARYKRIESYAEIDINTIANAPIINFKWTDREDDRVHLGSTAQYWANTSLCNGVIPTTDEKLWTMGYGQIALASVVSVAKKVVNHEERIAVLERENKELREELKQYRRA